MSIVTTALMIAGGVVALLAGVLRSSLDADVVGLAARELRLAAPRRALGDRAAVLVRDVLVERDVVAREADHDVRQRRHERVPPLAPTGYPLLPLGAQISSPVWPPVPWPLLAFWR